MAMGTNTMVAAVGLVIGPVLGGALVGISWQWVFWFNVPLALLGAFWAATILRELSARDKTRGFDVPGTLTFVVGLTGLVYGISRGGISGWDDTLVTQKALSFGVPVCVVPWGRDQLDVAAHVVDAKAGTRVPRRKLSPTRLAAAVEEARGCRVGAARVKAGYEATGGAAAAADALEALLRPAPAR
jgi:hypothetical protein